MALHTSISLDDAVEAYLRILAATRADTTVRGNRQVLERFAVWYGPCQVRYMRPDKVLDWFVLVRRPHTDRSRVSRKPIQASTYNHYLSRLSSFFGWLAKSGVLKKDLLRDVDRMREQQKARLQPSPEEMMDMINSAGSARDRAFLATLCNTGCRQGEITALRVRDVDLESGYLAITVFKSALDDRFPISTDLNDELKSWMSQYARDIGGPLSGATTSSRRPNRPSSPRKWTPMADGSNVVAGGSPTTGLHTPPESCSPPSAAWA